MYFQIACPHCKKNLKVSEESAGRRVRCPYCHNVTTVKPPEQAPAQDFPDFGGVKNTAGETPAAGASEKADETQQFESAQTGSTGTNVGMVQSALIALGLSATYYLLIVLPCHKLYLGKLFLERGWIQYVLVFFMSWSAAILYLKWRKMIRQKESMLFDLLPMDISPKITVDTVGKFTSHIRSLPAKASDSFLINRVLRGLEHFRVLNNQSEVSSRLAVQSDIDATAVDTSYTLIKVFIWAIPILGFIGTVIGIGTAVGGFASTMENAADINALKESLGGVTGGLATAFDTTLVALVMSIMVMFPVSSMQNAEENLLNWVDEYCNENFLRRLVDVDRSAGSDKLISQEVQIALEKALGAQKTELDTWTKKLESIGTTVTKQVAKGLREFEEQQGQKRTADFEALTTSLLDKQKEAADAINENQKEVAEAIGEKQKEIAESINSAHESLSKLQQDFGDHLQNLTQGLEGLTKGAEETQSQVTQSMRESAQSLHGYFANLHQGLTVLNGVLERLGEQQVIVQAAPEPARRRWGLFGRKSDGLPPR